jgi:hypothetical protein
MVLDAEIARYYELLPELLVEHGEGKIVLIHHSDLVGVFDTVSEAYRAGLNAFGVVSFLLRPISEKEEALRIPALELGLLRAHL